MKGRKYNLAETDHKSVVVLHSLMKKMNVTMFGAQCFNHLKKLENSVVRGEGKSQSALKARSKVKKRLEGLSKYMKSQHSVPEQRKFIIVSLPKQEYGKHESYSTERDFSNNHFIEEKKQIASDRKDEIDTLMRKFRLAKKKQDGKLRKQKHEDYKLSADSNKQIFSMKAGNLVCKQNRHITEIYDNDLGKFRSASRNLSRRCYSYEPSAQRHSEVFDRLHPKNNFAGGKLYQKLTSKYSSLFTTEIKRPCTVVSTAFSKLN